MDEFFAILAGVVVVSMPFLLVAFMRFLRYRETMALAEHGLLREVMDRPRGGGQGMLRWGIILTALGTALSCGLWPIGFAVGGGFPLGFGPWMLVGFLPLSFGLALLLIHRLGPEVEEVEYYDDELPAGGPYGVGMGRIGPERGNLEGLPAVEGAVPAGAHPGRPSDSNAVDFDDEG